jgi:hypothetical protein
MEQLFGQNNRGLDEVKARIKKLKVNLGLLSKDTIDEEKYYLIAVPDTELTPDQKRLKK